MSVGRVVDVFVQLGAGGEDRECQHEHGRPDRDEAVEIGNESDEAWHDDDVKSGGTEEGAIIAESSRGGCGWETAAPWRYWARRTSKSHHWPARCSMRPKRRRPSWTEAMVGASA